MTGSIFGRALPIALALLVAGLMLSAYRDLPGRPFAADDYQWLLNVRDLSPAELLRRAFDTGEQTHFYRPLVWLLLWAQVRLFGLDPAGFHAVSLALHAFNAALTAWLVWRLLAREWPPGAGRRLSLSLLAPALAFAFVALHPAPFEAVVWISAQSELLAAALLLVALHLWLPPAPQAGDDGELRDGVQPAERSGQPSSAGALLRAAGATAALTLALLAKESAVIGIGLLFLAGLPRPSAAGRRAKLLPAVCCLLPLAVSAAYLALQADLIARNTVVQSAGYGAGPQLLLNPLRTLGLIAAPLPGTQHGDNEWLPLVGALVALAVAAAAVYDLRASARLWRAALALLLVLLPTAPFASPPDSRYTYLPVLAAAVLIGCGASRLLGWRGAEAGRPLGRLLPAVALAAAALALAWWSAGELGAREGYFAAASGPGGSLWRLASAECAAALPSRIVVVDPPLAPPHAEAIIRLACGPDVRPVVVGRDGAEDALRPGALLVSFPGGGAKVERRA